MSDDLSTMLTTATSRLNAAGVASPRHDAESLASWAAGTTRGRLRLLDHLTDEQRAVFELAVERRSRREPLQHITGSAAFRHLELEVGPGVFVPRPETEVMAGVAVQELRVLVEAGAAPRAVDLCTGSGAVALSMATEVPGSTVVGIELSAEAASFAWRNARGTGVDIRVADLVDAADELGALTGTVHVVTANPPYIPLRAWEGVDEEVRDYDPDVALWAGEDGLDAIRQVAQVAATLLVDGGLVACEHADVQGDSAPAVFASSGLWREVRDHVDLTGRPRFVTARRVPRQVGTGTMDP